MIFFKQVQDLDFAGELTFKISKDNGALNVKIILTNDQATDKSTLLIQPLLLNGTAEELDNGFFDAIREPVEKVNSLFINMSQFQISLEKSKEQSAMAKAEKNLEAEKKKQWDAIHTKIKELSSKAEYEDAIKLIPLETDFPMCANEISKVKKELEFKRSNLSLFN